MKHLKKISLVLAVVIAGVIFLGFKQGDDFKIARSLDIYYSLFRELNIFYVDDTDPEELVRTSIDAMLESLDPYTTFIPEEDLEDLKFMTTGQYGGIGAVIRKQGDYAVIAEPYKGFPAQESGLRAGDILLEIDGKSLKNMPLEKVSESLKGLPQTTLAVTFKRPHVFDDRTVKIVREEIQVPSVPYHGMLNDSIGYIHLNKFTQGSGNEVKQVLTTLRAQNQLSGLILDLRGNPGGLLDESVVLANIFVDKGEEIVSTKGKIKQFDKKHVTQRTPIAKELPLVVLVNRASASASEIMAGAMQDLDRAVVVGQRTFGKGLVQTTRPLSYNGQLKVTTAKYYIPSGRCIQALDYSNRNEDGSVGHIPDSLISEYSTRNGRTVYDGGGIRPDVEVTPDVLSKITISLITKNILFDYATKYVAEHPSIAPVEQFELSETDFQDFKNFLKGKDFDYETLTENKFEDLVETAKREKYYGLSKEAFASLEKKLAHDKYKDIQTFRDEIEQLLEEEIVARYYYQAGRIQTALEQDSQVDSALKVLHDPARYNKILSVNK